MSRYLVKTVEQYRCDSESEAKALINEAKGAHEYSLAKYSSEIKNTKAKGEVVDEWYRVMLTKTFTSEKDPIEQIAVSYGNPAEENFE